MNIFSKLTVICAACVALVASPALAAVQDQAIALEGEVKAVKTIRDAAGNSTTQLVEPKLIVPGDRLLFTTSYRHTGSEAADNFVVTNPLPKAVRLAPDADPSLVVSVDGGETFGTLETLSVATETGGTRTATHADVTHVRWTIASIAPGESGRIAFPVIIR